MPKARSQDAEVSLRHIDDVTGAIESLTEMLDRADDLPAMLRWVCQHATEAVPGADMAGVTLLRDGKPTTAAITDETVSEVDADQYRVGDGPCLEAATTGKVVRVDVEEAHERWPAFAASARRAGVRSYLAAPLVIDNVHSGAINLYGRQAHGFFEAEAALLELYTTAVEAGLRTASRYLDARALAGQLRTALESRAVIDQAKGIIMAARRIDADSAFALLVEQSQREQVKLRLLAERFVAGVAGTGGDDVPG
ncbi:transcriptional regulator [Amycolatopsis antarctica]|uniref:Transcriptional regulator n=2 Tax=Amycolatopsis antarctica TaxID=1854586 RepID=A0A263D1Z8_9PSEU|nr:GAF and ANTAR domain-containing protein [Amycolatopsis antarctica]OZM72492.1 transcriptional regulator [Amycolatopsis antarctica]